MRIIKSIIVAFSMYSKIPMPQFAWKDEDMRYALCFFPWVGMLIGICLYVWNTISRIFGIQTLCYTLIAAVIPLLITGGFHTDGYMDTMDAWHSYQPKERKLEILKDAHIGAFSVIMLAVYGMVYIAAFSEIQDPVILKIVCAGFYLSRCLSGISVVTFPSAKKEGLLYLFASKAHKHIVRGCLYVQTILCIGYMCFQSVLIGSAITVAAFGAFVYYDIKTKKELAGITGDTAGYFVLICECSMVVMAAVINIVG